MDWQMVNTKNGTDKLNTPKTFTTTWLWLLSHAHLHKIYFAKKYSCTIAQVILSKKYSYTMAKHTHKLQNITYIKKWHRTPIKIGCLYIENIEGYNNCQCLDLETERSYHEVCRNSKFCKHMITIHNGGIHHTIKTSVTYNVKGFSNF